MLERLQNIENRYLEVTNELSKPEILSNIKETTKLRKEQANLEDSFNMYQEYKSLSKSIKDLKELVKDKELGEIAKEELSLTEIKLEELKSKIEVELLPKDPNDGKNVIIEIRGAAGGDEANIFAGDLFEMYSRYALNQGWKLEVINEEKGSAGGFSQIEFMIKGDNVYSKLKYESGSHRVQRVPTTETQGRVHTSTSTVLVMPEAEEFDIELKPQDIRVDVFRSGGCGGQGVNTTDSAVRMTHIPTGIVVTCQNERSQIQNREICYIMLRNRLYEQQLREHEEVLGNERKNKIGTGDRSEKIRTYNYPQNRVTDHRIGLTLMQLDRIMQGDLNEIIESLIAEDQNRKLKGE